MVDAMAKDLRDLNRRLNKKGSLTEGGYYNHTSTSNYWENNKQHGGKPYYPKNNNDYNNYPSRNYKNRHDHGRGGKRGRGRGKRGGYNNYGRNNNHNYGRRNEHNYGRHRSGSRSRSRDREQKDDKPRILPDFPEGYSNNWDRKKAYYTYKDGVYYGNSKLEDHLCHFWCDENPNGKPCTFGNRKCKWHHMCKYCGMIAEHKPANCPNRMQMRI